MKEKERAVLYYDGICNFCNKLASIMRKIDKNRLIVMKPIQSQFMEEKIIPEQSIQKLNTVILEKDGIYYLKTDAIFEVIKILGGFYKLLLCFKIFPKSYLDKFYDYFAKNRYHWFGTTNNCKI